MKKTKTKITGILLLSSLVLLTSINISLAADPSDYVGVTTTSDPAWTVSMHGAGMLAIADDMPESNLPFNASSAPSWLSSATFSMNLYTDITAISGEGQMDLFNGTDVDHVNVTLTGYYQLPIINITSETSPPLEVVILDPDTSNFTYLTGVLLYKSMNKMFGGNESTSSQDNLMLSALLMPKNITWAPIVSDLNVYLDMINDTMQASVFGNGVRVTIPKYAINATTQKEEIVIDVTYNGDGLLASATLKYGGVLALSITYGATGIPGFELTIVIGMSGIAAIGLIYTVRRKRKILSI